MPASDHEFLNHYLACILHILAVYQRHLFYVKYLIGFIHLKYNLML